MGKFFSELKRRNVYRTTAAYMVFAWLVVQVADAVADPLAIPEWVMTGLIALLGLGLPLSVAVAWFYEWTPEGLKTQEAADAVGFTPSRGFGRHIDFVIIALLLVAVGWLVWRLEAGPPVPEKSIAVLPFVTLSGGPDDEFFSDGLTEELLNVLAQVDDLKVTGRTSSFYYKGKDVDLRTIGQQLGVAHVLEGSVRRSGSGIRITAQLISTEDGFHLWSETYDRAFADIFAIQDDIARRVVNSLKIELLGDEAERLVARGTNDPEAQRLYLIARAKFRTRLVAEMETAILLLERALERDSRFADAWATLAHVRVLAATIPAASGEGDWVAAGEAVEQAKIEVDRALTLDPLASNAWVAKGFVLGQSREWDEDPVLQAEMRSAFDQALKLDPDNVEALHIYAIKHFFAGDLDAALPLLERGIEIDPLFARSRGLRAEILRRLGRIDEARRAWSENTEIFPKATNSWLGITDIESKKGHLHHAVLWLEEAFRVAEPFPANLLRHASLSMSLGDPGAANVALERLRAHGGGLAEGAHMQALLFDRDYEGLLTFLQEVGFDNDVPVRQVVMATMAATILGKFDLAETYLMNLPGLPFAGLPVTEMGADLADVAIDLALIYSRTGRGEQAEAIWNHYLELSRSPPIADDREWRQFTRLFIFASSGRTEEALAELDALHDAGFRNLWSDGWSPWFGDLPYFDSIRDEPRFRAFFDRIGEDNARMRAELEAGLTFEAIRKE